MINYPQANQQPFDQEHLLNQITLRIGQFLDLQDVLDMTVREVQGFLGVERVKIYRFDTDGSGEVVAEAVQKGRLPSLRGLHFPASDIPPQARELFMKARQRVIVDVASQRKTLSQAQSPRSLENSALGDARYSAVDPCHLQYLTAMGVAASLSLPILYQNQLWGLLVAHHSQSRSFAESELQTVQLLVDQLPIAIAQADLMQQAQQQAQQEATLSQLSQLLSRVDQESVWQTVLEQISRSVAAIGGRLFITESQMGKAAQIYTWGEQPTHHRIETDPVWKTLMGQQGVLAVSHRQGGEIARSLPTEQPTDFSQLEALTSDHSTAYTYTLEDLAQEPRLRSLVSVFEPTAIRSLLILPLQYQQYVGCLTLFRPAVETERLWAGQWNLDERNLRPRQSFAAWREIKAEQTIPWTLQELKLARRCGLHLYITILQQRVEDLLRQHTSRDLLTGLPNRLLFDELLALALMNIRRQGGVLAIMLIDLDRFKTINDTLGYGTGDRLLQQVTERLRACLRETDTVARWGDDEFTVLLPQIRSAEDAAQVAQAMLTALKTPFLVDDYELRITASIGITLAPYDGDDAETLLKCADTTLNRAKQQGKDNYLLYTPTMHTRSLESLVLGNHLYNALDRQELSLYYQPQTNLKTGKVVGMEALLRWQHPEMGMISPSQFIPLAEETGLICAIGEWVLRTACLQNRQWQQAGFPPLRVSVNLSPRQFQESNLVQKVAQILQETGLEPHYLELEITESLVMQDMEFAVATLRELQRLGVQIAMDDFGTGYSSLSALMHLPVNTLKIDQSFVHHLTKYPGNRAIISSVISLGHGLSLKLIAEGVETVEQLEFLRLSDCDLVQGYLFSRPLPGEAATQFLYQQTQTTKSLVQPPLPPMIASVDISEPVIPLPANEVQRLVALRQYHILDTPAEPAFDNLTRLIANLCQTPIAWISLVDEQRQWCKSVYGIAFTETSRTAAFCTHTILQSDLLLVPDTLADSRFRHHVCVTEAPRLRFYAGAPLVNPQGFVLGALCVADYVPRSLTLEQQEALKILAEQVMSQMELRRSYQVQAHNAERSTGLGSDGAIPETAIADMQSTPTGADSEQLAQLATAIGEILNRAEPLPDQLHHCVSAFTCYLDVVFAGIWLRNESTDQLELQAGAGAIGWESDDLDGLRRFQVDWILQHRQSFQTPILLEHPQLSDREWAIRENLTAFVGYPLVVDHATVGVLSLFLRKPLPQGVLNQLATLSGSIAHTLEYQRTGELLRQQVNRERLLAAISQRIRQSLELDEILKTTVEEVRQFLQTDRVIIFRFKPDWSGVVTVESVADNYPRILKTLIDEPCFRHHYVEQYAQGRVRAIEDIYTAGISPCHLELLAEFKVRANLVVPVLQGDHLWGLLIAHQCSGPRHWKELEISLLSQLATQAAIAIQQSELYQQVQRLATVDALTQIANRRRFDEYLSQIWSYLSRSHSSLSLILCDVDFFKAYNDNYGHPAGDICLQKVAHAIQTSVSREGDLLARYGGEEFAVILPNTSLDGAFQVAERIRLAVRNLQLEHRQSPLGQQVSLSLGIATYVPSAQFTPSLLIATADQALYQAKQQGRDRTVKAYNA